MPHRYALSARAGFRRMASTICRDPKPTAWAARVEEDVSAGHTLNANPTWTRMEADEGKTSVPGKGNQVSCHGMLGELEKSCKQLSPSVYSTLLQSCGHGGSLLDGKIVHDHIIKHGSEQNTYVLNCLGYMYGHCGALREACALFVNMHSRDVFSWNFLIRAYAQHGQVKEALHFFHQMQLNGVYPDRFSFISILSACDNQAEGMVMHTCTMEHGFERDILVGNALVNFYGKCGNLEDSQRIFNMMRRRDLVSWNSIITGYAQCGEVSMAFLLFQQMQHDKIKPDKVTFITLLSASADEAALVEGRYIHILVVGSELATDISVGNALVNLYGKCGVLTDAWIMFEKMPRKDIISWNTIITAYVHNGEGKRALQLYSWLQLEGRMPNKVSLISILDACACEGSLTVGKRMHAHILHTAITLDTVVGTAIVHMYGKCSSSQDAQKAFDNMPVRNLFSWNTIIAAHSQCEQGIEALCMFDKMQCEGILPNHVTFVSTISACANQATLLRGKCMHALVFASNFWGDVVIGTSLVHMYGKHGHVEDAQMLFEKVPVPNLVSWNAIIAVFAQHGHIKKVHKLCNQMQQEGLFPDKVTFLSILSACATPEALRIGKQAHTRIVGSTYELDVSVTNAIVNMYGECGAPEDAWRTFESMLQRSVFTWNALIGAYIQNGQGVSALEIFHRMQWEGVMPDEVTFISILGACTMEVSVGESGCLHTCFIGSGLKLDVSLGSAFINMYGKCGRLKDARRMFDRSPKHKVDTWNAIVSVYAQSGQGKEALHLFIDMQEEGVVPNDVTFVSVLCGCSHAGLIVEGCHCFNSMIEEHSITPKVEHYNCMIDLLGRAGKLDEAEYLANKMPFRPMITPLLTLLAACRHQADVRRGERIANLAFRVDPDDPTPYVMLWNIYATAGKGEDAAHSDGFIEQHPCSIDVFGSSRVSSAVHKVGVFLGQAPLP